ncbi:isocitrate dehydrogenase, partial [bacterium]|nr:isocitrate dehydrogenase [bacterium]
LRHVKLFEEADLLEDAVLKTLEDGKAMTRDVVGDLKAASTTAFAEAIQSNLGKSPPREKNRTYRELEISRCQYKPVSETSPRKEVGVDVFIEANGTPDSIGQSVESLTQGLPLKLKMISNRGTKLYPSSGAVTDTVNHWRCRFTLRDPAQELNSRTIRELLQTVENQFRWMHVERLQEIGGAPGFTKAQGED